MSFYVEPPAVNKEQAALRAHSVPLPSRPRNSRRAWARVESSPELSSEDESSDVEMLSDNEEADEDDEDHEDASDANEEHAVYWTKSKSKLSLRQEMAKVQADPKALKPKHTASVRMRREQSYKRFMAYCEAQGRKRARTEKKPFGESKLSASPPSVLLTRMPCRRGLFLGAYG